MYTKKQKESLALHLQKKFMSNEIEGYEIAATLIAMVEYGSINEDDVTEILMFVHFNNPEGVLRALERCRKLIDDDIINSVVSNIKNLRS